MREVQHGTSSIDVDEMGKQYEAHGLQLLEMSLEKSKSLIAQLEELVKPMEVLVEKMRVDTVEVHLRVDIGGLSIE